MAGLGECGDGSLRILGYALPTTPFICFRNEYSPAVAGILVPVVSAGLGAIAPLMQRELAANDVQVCCDSTI